MAMKGNVTGLKRKFGKLQKHLNLEKEYKNKSVEMLV